VGLLLLALWVSLWVVRLLMRHLRSLAPRLVVNLLKTDAMGYGILLWPFFRFPASFFLPHLLLENK
jgi:hypothetical protein